MLSVHPAAMDRDVIHCRFAVVITKKVSRMRHLKISGSAPPISVDIEEA